MRRNEDGSGWRNCCFQSGRIFYLRSFSGSGSEICAGSPLSRIKEALTEVLDLVRGT